MPETIEVTPLQTDPTSFQVTITTTADDTSTHQVTVAAETAAAFGVDQADTDQLVKLVRLSIRFLLARESKEAILPTFALADIEHYFPEYSAELRAAMNA